MMSQDGATRWEIQLQQLSKRYRREWIFRNVDVTFISGQRHAVVGYNGSGKSTLLKILSGHLTPSKGSIQLSNQGKKVAIQDWYRYISFAAPYIELIEEMTLQELIAFQGQFKPYLKNWSDKELATLMQLPEALKKEVGHFSSGMKQRLRLGLAVLCDTPVVLLDEPSSNLDLEGIAWYQQLLREYTQDRLVVIASNVEEDLALCTSRLNIVDFKRPTPKATD